MRASLARQRRFVVKAVAIAAAVVGMGFLSGCDIDVRSLLESCTDEARIVGTDGPDVLRGTAKDDVISSLGGDDTIIGAGGDDLICGGDGNDTIRGDSGIDVISGDAGDDRIEGGADVDVVYFVFSPAPVTVRTRSPATTVRTSWLAASVSRRPGQTRSPGEAGSTRSTVRPETTRSTVGRAWISSTSRWRPVAWRSISPRELPEDGDPIDSWVSKPSAVRPGATPSPVTPTTTTSTAVEERMSPEAAVGATSSRAAAAAMRLPAELETIASTVGAAATVSTAAPGAIAACTASRSEAVPKPPS
jgi:RTX calcium-binding nonapeptide repeat (4 copies)